MGSTTSWKANEKPCRRVWSSGPRTVAPVALMAPVATDLAARLMPQDKCKCRANPPKAPIGKFEHQSGQIDQTMERFAPGEAGGWSDSPQGVERIAPLGSLPTTSIGNRAHQSGIARTNREISARIGNGAHQSGNSSTNQESRARIGRRSGRAAREAQVDS